MWLMYNVMRPWCQKMEAKLSFSDTTLSPPPPPPPPRFLPVWVCVMAVSQSFSALYILFRLNLKKTRLTAHVNVLLWSRPHTKCHRPPTVQLTSAFYSFLNLPQTLLWCVPTDLSAVMNYLFKKKKKKKKLLAKTYRFEWKAWNYSVSLYWKDKTCINHP